MGKKKGDIFVVKELYNNNIIIYIMCGLFGIGVLLKFVLSRIYSSLIRASENMGSAKNKLTQVMKLKFETFYKLKIGVNNVDIFVDKYVYHHKFCGILLSTWENICGQALITCLLVGSVGSILGLIYECGKTQILSVFSVGIVSSGLLIIFDGILNLSGKKELIRLNMKDYLENFLKVRLEQQLLSPEMIEQYKKEYLEKEEIKGTMNPDMVTATADNHYIMVEKSESMDKPLSKKEKRISKKERKKLARMEAAQIREAVKLEKKRRKEDAKESKILLRLEKRQSKLNKKQAAKESRLEVQRMKEMKKEEAKLALEHKRAEERAEMERSREELRKAEERRKEEKIRQQEIQKVLLLEKRIAKENKKDHGKEQKTIAQERKENLMREIQKRREEENTVKMLDLEENLESFHKKNSNDNEAILSKKESLDNIKEVASVSKDRIKKQKEEAPKENINELITAESKKEDKTSKVYQNKTQTRGSNSKKKRTPDQLEDKLIEDILKEFLA